MQSIFQQLKNAGKGNLNGGFIRRWPTSPKVAFFGPPNVFLDELAQRYVKRLQKSTYRIISLISYQSTNFSFLLT